MPFFRRKKQKTKNPEANQTKISPNIQTNIALIKKEMGNSTDLIFHSLRIGADRKQPFVVLYMDGMLNKRDIIDMIKTLKLDSVQLKDTFTSQNSLDFIKESVFSTVQMYEVDEINQLLEALLNGCIIILGEGWTRALIGNLSEPPTRAIAPPTAQTVVRGPKDSFTESIVKNRSLLRQRLKSKKVRVHDLQIGELTHTTINVMYIEGITNPKIVEKVISDLKSIQIDGVLESGYIEAFIENKTFTPFPTVFSTERPDIVAGNLLEGRVAILVDQTPYVLLVPSTFSSFFQSVEDYYHRPDIATFIRIIRYITFFISLITPSLYIALIAYHPGMLPTPLAINLMAQREGVPFPTVIEAILMEVVLEALREAGIRSPRPLSMMISIVGAIVLGDVAIRAGVVSAGMVMVVAITAISSFATPNYSIAISARIIRFLFMFLAGVLGLFGITMGLIFLVLHMNSLRSYGIPYLSPFAPFILRDQKDTILRAPLWSLNKRPKTYSVQNETRIPKGQQPENKEDVKGLFDHD